MTPEHRDKQQEALARHFIQIPMEIFFDKALTSTDKIIYGRINTFDEFFESNSRTADILGICEKQVRRSKKHLLDLGYIKLGHNDGRGKSYTANEAKLHDIRRAIAEEIKRCPGVEIGQETCEHGAPIWHDERTICPSERTICPEKRTICPTENKERLKRELKENKTKEKTEPDQLQQFGNPDINALLDAWAEATGFDYKKQRMERYAMAGLLKTHGLDATKALISRVKLARRSGDRFAPQIAKPSQLRGKYSKFEALTMWEERREAEQSSTPTGPTIPKNPDYFYENPDAYDTGETREEIHERCEKLREKYGFGPRKELD